MDMNNINRTDDEYVVFNTDGKLWNGGKFTDSGDANIYDKRTALELAEELGGKIMKKVKYIPTEYDLYILVWYGIHYE